MPRFVELSHQIVAGMKTYPGLPEPTVDVLLDYDASRERYLAGRCVYRIAVITYFGGGSLRSKG